jgi:glutathionylspermidine synthase
MVTTTPLRAFDPLPPGAFAEVRVRTIFDCCKWDPQVEDVSTLAAFPLGLDAEDWSQLAGWSERLAAETLAAEMELLRRPDIHHTLGLPRSVCRALHRAGTVGVSPSVARVTRFDFHFTTGGWRISEANTDVPGGFIEAAGFTRAIAAGYPGAAPAGDPAAGYADALLETAPRNPVIGLVHATAYTDDRQVMAYLARHLRARGVHTALVGPSQVRWEAGIALLDADDRRNRADALIRFFPGEWLPNLPRASGWKHFFFGAATPLSNPATALLTQTKRLPLVWDSLATGLPTWRALLPETHDPREVRWQSGGDWVLKPALGRVGDGIGIFGITPAKDWKRIASDVRWHPRHWIAQRRFDVVPISTPDGPRYPCLGVFVIGGRAAGIYGRIAPTPLINHRAQDIAVLVRPRGPSAPNEKEEIPDDTRTSLSRMGA